MVSGQRAVNRVARRSAAALRSGARYWCCGAMDLVFPPTCVECGGELSPSQKFTHERRVARFCEDCRRRLLNVSGPVCPRCAARVPRACDAAGCPACSGRSFAFSSVVALGFYDGELRKAVLKTKRMNNFPVAFALAELVWQQCGDRLAGLKSDAVAAVPMYWMRRLRRGMNAPDILCEELARRLRVPAAEDLLIRCRNTRPQADLAQGRRRANLRGAFRVRSTYELRGARILLVDDILTTGATAHEAAAALRAAGAADVTLAVITRSDLPIGSRRGERLKTSPSAP